MKNQNKSHPGKAGRKPAALPYFLKKFRASKAERKEFAAMLTGDARKDFELILDALRKITI